MKLEFYSKGFLMIIVKNKPFEKIAKMLVNYRNALIVGCNGCAGIYQVGGEKQALMMNFFDMKIIRFRKNS